jgi:hypothetical protein
MMYDCSHWTDASTETHEYVVPTDLMRPEDVPACTPSLERKNAQGHGTTSVRLLMGLVECEVKGEVLRKGNCSVWHCYYSLLGCTHCSPPASSFSQRRMLEKDCVGKNLETDCVRRVSR